MPHGWPGVLTSLMEEILIVAGAYLIGAVPFAYLVSRHRGIDLRRVGSGNVGASNVLRTSGVSIAVLALCLDGVKGAAAVVLAERMGAAPATPIAAGLASVLGHVYPVWLRFHGGKGVATAAGVFAVLTPLALALAGMVFVLAIWVTRYISVGSIAGAITVAIVALSHDATSEVAIGAVLAAVIIVHCHRTNLARLVAGTERRVGQRLFKETSHQ
jgi:acyl phosphate:glycerol-3-phosphate acyltransferase